MGMFVVLAQAEHTELPVPPVVIGAGAFILLLLLLAFTLAFGKGRPHA